MMLEFRGSLHNQAALLNFCLFEITNQKMSAFNKSVAIFLFATALSMVVSNGAFSAESNSSDDTSSVIPFAPARSSQQFVMPPPATIDTHPAQAQERPPIPAPDPSDQLPPPVGTGIAKPSLAGRAAFLLHHATNKTQIETHTSVAPTTQNKVPTQAAIANDSEQNKRKEASRSYLASFEDTFMAIIATCAQTDLVIDSMDSNQGTIVLHTKSDTNSNDQIVLIVREIASRKTDVSAARSRPLNTTSQAMIDDLLLRVSSLVSKGGTL